MAHDNDISGVDQPDSGGTIPGTWDRWQSRADERAKKVPSFNDVFDEHIASKFAAKFAGSHTEALAEIRRAAKDVATFKTAVDASLMSDIQYSVGYHAGYTSDTGRNLGTQAAKDLSTSLTELVRCIKNYGLAEHEDAVTMANSFEKAVGDALHKGMTQTLAKTSPAFGR